MIITYELDLSKSNVTNFSELVLTVLEQLMKMALVRKWVGGELVVLENRLNELIPKQNRGKTGDFRGAYSPWVGYRPTS